MIPFENTNVWLIVAIASFILCVVTIFVSVLVLTTRKPKADLDDFIDEDRTKSGVFMGLPFPDTESLVQRRTIAGSMAKPILPTVLPAADVLPAAKPHDGLDLDPESLSSHGNAGTQVTEPSMNTAGTASTVRMPLEAIAKIHADAIRFEGRRGDTSEVSPESFSGLGASGPAVPASNSPESAPWDDDPHDDGPMPTSVYRGFFSDIVDQPGVPPKLVPKAKPVTVIPKALGAVSVPNPSLPVMAKQPSRLLPRAIVEPPDPTADRRARQEQNAEVDETMLRRPSMCPVCGEEPNPDYYSEAVEDGIIFTCGACQSIVYVEPHGIAHKYLGKTYHTARGKEFKPPPAPMKPLAEKLPDSVATDGEGFVDTESLFGGIIDP